MKNWPKRNFPNIYGFPNWKIQEVGFFLLLIMFAVIGLIMALLV